jgi:hypothetical protein
LKATIRRLKQATILPDYDHLSDMNQDQLDERQTGIDTLIKLYTDQVTRDYNMFRLQKEQLVLLSHLTQRQSIELLEVNLKLSQMIDLNRQGFQLSMTEDVLKTSAEMEKKMEAMFDQHRKFVSFATTKLADKITQYDTNDMRKVLESQKQNLYDVLAKNALLVTENSELRMHMSFVPVEYRDYISGLQGTNHEYYRNQRSDPKIIIPDTGHLNSQSPIRLMNAPMAHPSVIAMFRDARYETFFDVHKVYEKGFALRARITENVDTKRIPKTEEPWRLPGPIHLDKTVLLSPKRTTNNPPRVPLDQRLVNPATIPRPQDQRPPPRGRQEPPPQAAPQGADHGTGYVEDSKGWGKGKRQPNEMANRFQPPQKSARGGDTTPSPWIKATMSMPTPPGAASQSSSSSNTPSAPKPPPGLSPAEAGVPGYTGESIWPLTRNEAIKYYNAYTSRPLTILHEDEDGSPHFDPLSDFELARILTKLPNEAEGTEITEYDQNMSIFIMQQMNECLQAPSSFMYEFSTEGRKIILDIDGNKVPITRNAYDPSNANVLYRLLHPTMIAKVGNYYYCLRQRPGKKGNQFEYIPNRKYSYREVKRTLAQIKISVLPSRMWDETPLTVLTDKMLHPYTEYCPCVTLDYFAMETACGIAHIPYGAEIVHREPLNNAAVGASAKAPRQLLDSPKTVQRLQDLGVLSNQDKPSILALKAILDDQIKIATAEKERVPSAVGQRVIQMYLNRWSLINKALEYVGNPYNVYGRTVNNLPSYAEEGDDKKRKASRSLSHITTPGQEEEGQVEENTPPQQQAEDIAMDRQSPEGSGGNPV